VYALIDFKPIRILEQVKYMGESRSFRNSTSSRVENRLKTINLRTRKIEKERVAIVYLGMNET